VRRSQPPRLASETTRARHPRASRPVAPGGLSRPLVAGAPGCLVCASWAARPLRSPRSARQRQLSAWSALVARHPAASGHRNEPHTVSSLPPNPHGMGVLPPLLIKCQGEREAWPVSLDTPRPAALVLVSLALALGPQGRESHVLYTQVDPPARHARRALPAHRGGAGSALRTGFS